MKYIETIEIAVDQVDDKNRLRLVDQDWVEALAESITNIGQKEPIEIVAQKRKGQLPYRLISGAHRLAACRLSGLDTIRAEVKTPETDNPDLEIRLHEIDENLIRNELNALDRAVFLGERKKVYEAMYPETARGGDRGNQHTGGKERQTEIISFSQATAEKIDLGERTIRRATRIFEGLSAEVRARIHGTPLARKEGELYQLTQYDRDRQLTILDMCLRKADPVPSVKAAGDIIDGHIKETLSEADAHRERLYETWNRCKSKKGRKGFLDYLVEMGVITSYNEAQL